MGGAALFARYSRTDEAEADSEAVLNVIAAGLDPHGIPTLFRRLIEERRTAPLRIAAFFASHPLEEDRIVATEREISALDPRELEGCASTIRATRHSARICGRYRRPPSRRRRIRSRRISCGGNRDDSVRRSSTTERGS